MIIYRIRSIKMHPHAIDGTTYNAKTMGLFEDVDHIVTIIITIPSMFGLEYILEFQQFDSVMDARFISRPHISMIRAAVFVCSHNKSEERFSTLWAFGVGVGELIHWCISDNFLYAAVL